MTSTAAASEMRDAESFRSSERVAIIGAGPVGLSMANELSWRGVPNILIERRTETLDFPTSESVHTRTMELFRRWDLAAKIRDSGFPQDLARNVVFVTTLTGFSLAKINRPSNREQRQLSSALSPEGALWCPKFLLDKILMGGVHAQHSTEVMLGWEMVGFDQESDAVSITIKRLADEQQRQLRVRFLAACDGASSPTRKSLGFKMEGTFAERRNLGIYFRSAKLAEIMSGLGAVMANILNPDFQGNLTFVDGNDLWRLVFFDPARDASDLDPGECIRRAVGQPIDVEILDARAWAGHSAVAARFREGNVFLLGDAANLRWPHGGFGMNTGVGDVLNLGWKFEAVIKGWGGAGLLDSYEAERRPIAQAIVREASGNFRGNGVTAIPAQIVDDSLEGSALRQTMGASIGDKRAREWNTIGIQLGQIYEESPIDLDDGTPPLVLQHDVYNPTTKPGGRAPHLWLGDDDSILDRLGRGYCLVHWGVDDAAVSRLHDAAVAAAIPLHAIELPLREQQAVYEKPFVLVRPDGIVCWRGDSIPGDCADLWRKVTGRVEEPRRSHERSYAS